MINNLPLGGYLGNDAFYKNKIVLNSDAIQFFSNQIFIVISCTLQLPTTIKFQAKAKVNRISRVSQKVEWGLLVLVIEPSVIVIVIHHSHIIHRAFPTHVPAMLP
jgi:hypothetical protein